MTRKIGIIGAGFMGDWHAERWRHLPVALAGFYDVDRQKAETLARTYGTGVFSSVEDLVRASDVVQVCSPSRYHREAIEIAAAHGRTVFTEKPLARQVADAQAIVDVCERAGVRLFVGHVLRFFHQYAHARALIQAGAVGLPMLVRLVRAAGHPAELGGRDWFRSVTETGGVLMEGAIHDLDFARWCFGEVDRVFTRGITLRQDIGVPGDHVLVTLAFRSGVIGHVESNWMVTDGVFRQQIEVIGSDGMLEYDSVPADLLYVDVRPEVVTFRLPEESMHPQDDPYLLQLRHFLDCLDHDREFLISPRDAVEAVRMSLAALRSMETGAVVTVAEVA